LFLLRQPFQALLVRQKRVLTGPSVGSPMRRPHRMPRADNLAIESNSVVVMGPSHPPEGLGQLIGFAVREYASPRSVNVRNQKNAMLRMREESSDGCTPPARCAASQPTGCSGWQRPH
jgi:hypothetical protein